MEFEIKSRPSYSLLEVKLSPGEEIIAETGAMAYMKNVEIKTGIKGGLLGGLKRKILGGESFFTNTFKGKEPFGVVGLSPKLPGDIAAINCEGELYVQSASFLACEKSVDIDIKWAGAKGFFSGEGIFLLRLSGYGKVFLSSFGGIEEVEVDGEGVTVDTGHIVAFTPGLDWSVGKAGGIKELFFSGEGLVAKFKGRGKIWIQTRTLAEFADALHFLCAKKNAEKEAAAKAAGVISDILSGLQKK